MSDQPNFFEQLGNAQMTAPAKAKIRAQEKRAATAPMVLTPQEKAIREQHQQLRAWRKERRARLREQLTGPNGAGWRELHKVLKAISIEGPGALLEHVRRAKWMFKADGDTRYMVLSVIGASIVRLRIRNGLEPFDDGLWDEDTAFVRVRRWLTDPALDR